MDVRVVDLRAVDTLALRYRGRRVLLPKERRRSVNSNIRVAGHLLFYPDFLFSRARAAAPS